MILWLTGNSGSGKTTLAGKLASHDTVILDGDAMRGIWPELGLSNEDRRVNNLRTAELARLLEVQGLVVIVAMICPFQTLREEVKEICGCKFIYLPGGKEGADYPYEVPEDAEITVEKRFKDVVLDFVTTRSQAARMRIPPGEHRD